MKIATKARMCIGAKVHQEVFMVLLRNGYENGIGQTRLLYKGQPLLFPICLNCRHYGKTTYQSPPH
ncbi:MAG: hypothetical protein QG657_1822 [Acidobacteriota bacterium]|nr:hypothetical protein [Acidobacteriota bacterium]